MLRVKFFKCGPILRRSGWSLLCLLLVGGCSLTAAQRGHPAAPTAGVNRRMQLLPATDPLWYRQTVTTQPAPTDDPLAKPYHLNVRNIVHILFEQGPHVVSNREGMIAAQHGLEEFRADLSRFEPFVQVDGTKDNFPNRRDSEGLNGEVVGGVEKETFDGAVLRLEGGASASRVRYGEVEEDQEEVDEGRGGLLRARIEVPFAGSRKRQDRIISAAFQESSARKAVLAYLTNYQNMVINALSYYHVSLYYLHYIRASEWRLDRLNNLLKDPRLRPLGQLKIQGAIAEASVVIETFRRGYRNYVLALLETLGIDPTERFVLQEDPFADTSEYLERSRTDEGRRQMLADAYANNPKFAVLDNAIKDAKLQRAQAILGTFDITAYVEGAQFPFGAETYDDRVGGWQVSAGLSVRLNDQRVLTATRKKTEAQIRNFRAQIEAERLRIQQDIAVQTEELCEYYALRPTIRESIEKSRAEYINRCNIYFTGEPPTLTIDEVLNVLETLYTAETRVAANIYDAWLCEDRLRAATGEVYCMVGLTMAKTGNGQ